MTLIDQYLSSWTMTKEDVIKWDNLINMLPDGAGTRNLEVSEEYAAKYDGDFYGLLLDLADIEDKYLYPNMLANGFNSPSDYKKEIRLIRIIDSKALQKMLLTINKKS